MSENYRTILNDGKGSTFRIQVKNKMTRKVIEVEAMKALIISGKTDAGEIAESATAIAAAMNPEY
jgi:hypothetical protein